MLTLIRTCKFCFQPLRCPSSLEPHLHCIWFLRRDGKALWMLFPWPFAVDLSRNSLSSEFTVSAPEQLTSRAPPQSEKPTLLPCLKKHKYMILNNNGMHEHVCNHLHQQFTVCLRQCGPAKAEKWAFQSYHCASIAPLVLPTTFHMTRNTIYW